MLKENLALAYLCIKCIPNLTLENIDLWKLKPFHKKTQRNIIPLPSAPNLQLKRPSNYMHQNGNARLDDSLKSNTSYENSCYLGQFFASDNICLKSFYTVEHLTKSRIAKNVLYLVLRSIFSSLYISVSKFIVNIAIIFYKFIINTIRIIYNFIINHCQYIC